jgi:tripartite-type tricarboxylate transporter receptor subunit TctC
MMPTQEIYMNFRAAVHIAIAAVAVMAAAPTSLAQTPEYPNRAIKYIVPFPPGGATDTLARELGKKLSDSMGQPVVVENRPGAGGNIGMEAAVRSPADGYTIVTVATATMAVNPTLYRNLTFDPGRDLVPVAFLAHVPLILVVNPSVPASNLKELMAYIKSNPGKVNFASPGSGTGNHLAGELFKQRTGLDIVHVPYKGDSQAFTDLIGGQVQMMFATMVAVVQHINSGRLKAIANVGLERTPALPDLPTMDESGLPGFDVRAWFGVAAPVGTPPAIVKRLNGEINKALQVPEVKARLAMLGAVPTPMTAEQFAALAKDEREKWGKLVRDSGARVD